MSPHGSEIAGCPVRLNSCVSRSVSGRNGSSREPIDRPSSRRSSARGNRQRRQHQRIALRQRRVDGARASARDRLAPGRSRRAESCRPSRAAANACRLNVLGRFLERLGVIRERLGQRDVHVRRCECPAACPRSTSTIDAPASFRRLSASSNRHARRHRAFRENSRPACRCAGCPMEPRRRWRKRRAGQHAVNRPRVADGSRDAAPRDRATPTAGPRRPSESRRTSASTRRRRTRRPGMRIDPPVSVPIDAHPMPAATAAAEPPLEPPGDRRRVARVVHGPECRFVARRAQRELVQVASCR